MMRRSGSPFLFLLTLLLLAAVPAQAQVGKIAGRVTDAGTGEALIGVNVVIDGTTQGSVTDLDGNFIILNVRPGDYSLVFSYIGYARKRVDGIRAVTGQTTRYNTSMSEQVIEGEEVVITAERPLVQKDLTSSRVTVNAEEIDALPVEGFFGVLATQAGVTTGADGAIHIRGGRSNEVAYLVDGMSVGNPFDTNGLATTVAADAIQEMTVISGAFNAEYGKAMSGIVNLVTKEGGSRLEGSISLYGGDNFTRHGDIFFTPDSRSVNVMTMEGTLSGRLPFAKGINFFLSGRRDLDDGHIYGYRQHAPTDSANFNGDAGLLETIQQYRPEYGAGDPLWYYELQGTPWYEIDPDADVRGERVALNPYESANFIAKLSTRPFPGAKLEYSFLFDRAERTPFNFFYRYNPDGVSTRRDRSFNNSVHWTQSIGDRMFYNLRFSIANNRAWTRLYDLGDVDPFAESTFSADRFPFYASNDAIRGFPGNHFLMGGDQKGHVIEDATSYRFKGDITRQIGVIHELKAGLDLQEHRLDRQNFAVLFDYDQYDEPTVLSSIESPAHDYYENQRVTELSAYVQDKLEFEDFIINAGLRFEYFDPHGTHIQSLFAPKLPRDADGTVSEFYPDDWIERELRGLPTLVDTDVTMLLMPRLGVSFPITETGIIHFSYGHFAQMPALRNMYVNPEYEFPVGGSPQFGNTDMRPQRTVQYEFGLQQQLTNTLAFDITGFFKDIRDYLASQTLRFSTIAGEDIYQVYLNRDYANVKGVTFALTKRRSRTGLLSATIDYTYQVAEGNRNDSNAFFFNSLSGRENEFELVPLSFDQPHVLSSTVTLTRPGNWGISFIGQYASGYPYTPQLFDQKIDQLPNQERKPSQVKLDAHLYKDFRVGPRARIRLFSKVFNVLDRLNERYVFDDTGRATYTLSESRGAFLTWERALELGLPGIHTPDEYNSRPHYYSAPREIRLGATLTF